MQIDKIFDYSDVIQDGRTLTDINKHLNGEVAELREEMYNHAFGMEPGADGVHGEAVDVGLCAFDLAYKSILDLGYAPEVARKMVTQIIQLKLEKWKRIYG